MTGTMRRETAQMVHWHDALEASQMARRLPALPGETGQGILGTRVGIQPRGDHDHPCRAPPTLLPLEADVSEEACVREGGVRLGLQPWGPGGLLPVHPVLVWPQTTSHPQVGTAQVVLPEADLHTALGQHDEGKPPAAISIASDTIPRSTGRMSGAAETVCSRKLPWILTHDRCHHPPHGTSTDDHQPRHRASTPRLLRVGLGIRLLVLGRIRQGEGGAVDPPDATSVPPPGLRRRRLKRLPALTRPRLAHLLRHTSAGQTIPPRVRRTRRLSTAHTPGEPPGHGLPASMSGASTLREEHPPGNGGGINPPAKTGMGGSHRRLARLGLQPSGTVPSLMTTCLVYSHTPCRQPSGPPCHAWHAERAWLSLRGALLSSPLGLPTLLYRISLTADLTPSLAPKDSRHLRVDIESKTHVTF
jgi:hypothetical protein